MVTRYMPLSRLGRATRHLTATARSCRALCVSIVLGIVCLAVGLPFLEGRLAEAAASSCQGERCLNLLFDGDSISAGIGASTEHGLDRQVVAAMGDNVRSRNVAVSGRPVYECLRLYDQRVAPAFDVSARLNVIVFHAGDNDISQGRSADQTYTAFTAYVAAAHRQGWKIVVSTELKRGDFAPLVESTLEDYNKLVRRNQANADAVVDLDTDSRLRDLSFRVDPSLFSRDKIHPNDGGYAVIAGMLASQIKRIFTL